MEREPYSVRELSVRTFSDFETLAIKQGGCWCIFYQRANPLRPGTTSEEWKRRNRSDKRALVRSGRSHAILVYEGRTPIGWCQYGGQEELPRIDARRTYRKVAPRVGVKKLWRITCFFVDPKYRGRGVAKFALRAALDSIGTKEEVSWKRTLWLHRRWQPCRSGVGSGRRGCSARKASAPSHPSGQAAFSCGKRLHLDAQRNLNSGPPIQRVAGR